MAIRGEPPTVYRWLDGRQRRVAQDFDGDGLDDLLIDDWGGPWYPEQALSGRDGSPLWKLVRHSGNASRPICAPLPLGDLAGEGRSAIISFAPHEPESATGDYVSGLEVAAYSGRDGHRLWAKNRGTDQVRVYNGSSSGSYNGRSYFYPSLGIARLDPHRPADVLVGVTATLDANAAPTNTTSSDVSLNVVAGDTGKVRWRISVVEGQFGDHGHIYRDEFHDLNGDGVGDIVAWILPPNAKYGVTNLELAAFSGADGSKLWPDAPAILGPQNNNGFMQAPVVSDLDGKGTPDVLFVRDPQWDKHELVVVGGRDGRIKWTWSWVGNTNNSAPPQVVDFAGDGRHSICLFLTEVIKTENSTTYQPRLVIFDGAGNVVKRIDAKGSGNVGLQFYGNESWWRGIDLGNGKKQALLFFDERALQALGGESIEPLWKWPLAADETSLLEVIPAGRMFPSTIAIWSGKSVYGLSCATGRSRWRGEMPGGITNWASGQADRVVMRDSNGLGLPRLLSGDGCRLTWPTDDAGRYLPPRARPANDAPVPDPIALRPLPWTEMPEAIPVILKMVPWSILWLVVPVLLMRRAFRQNSWRLAFVPAFYQLGMTLALNVIPLRMLPFNRNDWVDWDPHVGMCFLNGAFLIVHVAWMLRRRLWALVDASAIYAIAIAIGWSQRLNGTLGEHYAFPFDRSWFESLGSMLAVVFGGLPVLFGVVFIVKWLRRRQWIRLGLYILATIIGAAICAYTAIDKDRYWKGAEEVYSLDGWWLILLYGAYFAAVLAMTGWLVKWALVSVKPRLSRLLKRVRRRTDA
jgi:hypothetical protein